jgi:hypothetical protein
VARAQLTSGEAEARTIDAFALDVDGEALSAGGGQVFPLTSAHHRALG